MSRLSVALAGVALLAATLGTAAFAALTTTGAGPSAEGGGPPASGILLIETGSNMLIDVGSSLLITP
jgi:hypothetical protein